MRATGSMTTTPDPLHSDAARVLSAWVPPTADQDVLRQDYLTFLAAHPDAMTRANRIGHLTGSALVVDPSREAVLLTLHPLVGRWLQQLRRVEGPAREDHLGSAHPDRTLAAQRHLHPCRTRSAAG